MSFWADLVDAAVLGTARAAVPPPAPALADITAAGRADAGQAGATAELLRLAAVASRARRAGYVPAETDHISPDPAASDGRPPVSPAARQRLDDLLADGRIELVTEWLTLLAGAGRRPPETHLPALLTSATENQQLRTALTPTLGPRATWLAAANPAWAWATRAAPATTATTATAATAATAPGNSTPGPAAWTTASHRTRRDLLDRLRTTDPATARELVASTWTGDSPRDRTAFIAALAVGLSADDEPLLNRALADRRGEVRQAAAGLLAKLPGSAFSRRAADRAAAAVTVAAQEAPPGCQLLITPPPNATDEMIADGLYATAPQGTGLQAWLLRQVVAAAPAAWWTAHTKMSSEDLLTAAATTTWYAALAGGWIDAATRDAHVPWLTAFLDRFGQADYATALPEALLEALPVAQRDAWLAAHPDSSLFGAVALVPWPWSAALCEAARNRISAVARSDPGGPARRGKQWPNTPQHARRLLRVAAARLDPPAMPDVPEAEIHPLLAAGWAEMMNTLSVRAAMRRELAEEPPP